jgi:hypothetical protein
VNKPLDITANIKGKMAFGNLPKVTIQAKIPKGLVKTPVGDFADLSCMGYFTNAAIDSLPYTDENSMLSFKELKGNFEDIPISSQLVTIRNLVNPFLRCDLKAEANLTSLNNLLASSSFDFTGGQAKADVVYEGALMSDTSISMKGYIQISNGGMVYQPRNVKLENINGRVVFENEDVLINDLQAEAQSNKVKINSAIRNMLNLMMKDPSKLYVDADISFHPWIYTPLGIC